MNHSLLLELIGVAKKEKIEQLRLPMERALELPLEIGELKNLTSLSLRHNRVRTLPKTIGNLTNLESLNLSGSFELKELPETIGNLTNLTSLDLSHNFNLESLPETIGNLTNLTSLTLTYSLLEKLPQAIGNLVNLTSLTISYTSLRWLPKTIGNLVSLVSLDLSHNYQLNKLPESIGELTNLVSLNLLNNNIEVLPLSIGSLINLASLDLTSNKLEVLPDSIGDLESLKELKATKNRLISLPQSLSRLKELSLLTISSNNLDLPPEISRKRKPALILDFIRQQEEEGIDCIYEAKLLVIGEGGAGKTSLANKLIDPEYKLKLESDQNPEKSTEGIDVLYLDFAHPNGNSFRINLWDFGGQEIYHATHQFFLTKRSLYLLVADTRQDNTDFNYWLEVVELLSEASPTLIIKNEKQDRPCQVNENQLFGRFSGQLKDVISANLANNRGLHEIVTAVQHHICQLPHIGAPLPKTWVRVRDALETDIRNYMTQVEFLKLCDTHGFKRREDKLQLSGYLHDLGVCLHFKDDPVLKNWIILKPEWGTTAVYTVLDTPKIQKALGCFTHEDLIEIWADSQYADMRDELLQLMMRFKLCYEIPHRPRTYIAPQLLSPNQPKYDWDDTSNLILRYQYEFMPKGMLTRFSVEMHKLIDEDLIWKDGVILTDGNARAEVIETYYKKSIRIRISGQIKKSLLEKIRHEFDKIHSSYNNPDEPSETYRLRYQEFIPCNCLNCQGSQSPHSYALKRLEERLKNNRQEIECDVSYEMINVRELIDDAIGQLNSTWHSEIKPVGEGYGKAYEDMREIAKLSVNQGTIVMQEQNMSSGNDATFDLSKANIGAIATDNAQATVTDNTFTQTHNANTTELLNLIIALRETATQFPDNVQEDITINIEDIETEIQKPEDQRSIPRLKRSLIALAMVVSAIAIPVAGMTDFTNNVLEIANKFNIELPQLP